VLAEGHDRGLVGELPPSRVSEEIFGKKGYPFGQEIMEKATEGEIKEVTYWWPRPGSDEQVKKTSFYTKVGDQICGVGYYQD
jgi:signal transduction histidine kinase